MSTSKGEAASLDAERISRSSVCCTLRERNERRIAAMENANRACSADADCTIAGFGVRCFADCGVSCAV